MNLTYEAVDTGGRTVRDLIEAANIKTAVELLRQRGLMVTHIETASEREMERRAHQEQLGASHVKLPLKQLVLFTRQMAMLLTSGSSVVPALAAIARQLKKPEHVALLQQIKTDVEEGCTLTEALRKCSRTFDSFYCAVIAAGESSATLPAMFDRLARIFGRRRAMRNKVLASMAYPALLTFLCVGIVNVLLFFVLPRFGDMFDSLGMPLPVTTDMLLSLAAVVSEYWPVMVAGMAALVTGVALLAVTDQGRQLCANIQVRLPLAGRLASGLIQGQMFRTLGMLLESKVGVLDALDLVRGTTRNDRFQALFDRLESAVTSGQSLSDTLESSRLIDPAICQAVRTGEQTGSLGGSMSYAADIMDEDNTELVNTVTRLIEPLIIIIMGFVVGTVAISLFLPLFDITSMVQ